MSAPLRMLSLALLMVLPATCGGSDETCGPEGEDLPFGECCVEDAQCADGVCHEFGDGTMACTKACSDHADCPEGSQGQKCNKQDVCRV